MCHLFHCKKKKKQNDNTQIANPGDAFRYSWYFGIASVFFLVCYSLAQTNCCSFWNILGITVIIAFASFAFGGVIGFLFGVPHLNQQQPKTNTDTGATNNNVSQKALNAANNKQFSQSSNIEQIADWLTKIIVGVGLIEIHKIILLFNKLCVFLGNSLNTTNGAAVAGSIIILFSIDGFLIVFLWTSLYLCRIQNSMDEKKVTNMIEQNDSRNQKALDLAYIQLNAPEGVADKTCDELSIAFLDASSDAITSIFYQAVDKRKHYMEGNREASDKTKVKRVIPIFMALKKNDEADTNGHPVHPENDAELGFAYMEKNHPDYGKALECLDTAIKGFANKEKETPYCKSIEAFTYYSRAYCRMQLFHKNEDNSDSTKRKYSIEDIEHDLVKAKAPRDQHLTSQIEDLEDRVKQAHHKPGNMNPGDGGF